jgi:hypothetical protein
MTTTEDPDFSPYRLMASTPEEFVLQLKDGRPMLVTAWWICALGLIVLLFYLATPEDRVTWTIISVPCVIFLVVARRRGTARIVVSIHAGVLIKGIGPLARNVHVDKQQIRALQIDLKFLRGSSVGVVRLVLTEGSPIRIIGFPQVDDEGALRSANEFAREFTKRIPVEIIPYEPLETLLRAT